MCKTYDAIYELAQHSESDILICSLNNAKIEGKLHRCNCDFKDNRCYDGVITLKNAIVTCYKTEYKKEYEWINIASKHIQAFAFKCCEK